MAGTAAALAQQVVGGVPVPRTVRASAPTVRESVAWKAGGVLASFAAEFKHRMMMYQAKLAAAVAAVIFSLPH
jgi:hypothetical protein